MNNAVILNLTPFDGYHYFNLPRFDYDLIFLNVTLESTTEGKEVDFGLHLSGENIETTQFVSELTTMTLQTDLAFTKNSSDRWLVDSVVYVTPRDNLICHSLIVSVSSSVPLCPVSFDLKSTEGLSLYDNKWMSEMMWVTPALYVSRDNWSESTTLFYPRSVNDTLLLRTGSLNGTCGWSYQYYYHEVNFSISFSENERTIMIVHLRAVRVEITFDSVYPVYHIVWSEKSNDDEIYDLHLTSESLPCVFIVPPRNAYGSFYIADLLDDRLGSWRLTSVASVAGYIQSNGTHNLEIFVEFREAITILQIWDLGYAALSLVMFVLIISRIGVWMNKVQRLHKTRLKLDFRMIPPLLFSVLALFPWFSSTRLFESLWQDKVVVIHSSLAGPLPIMGLWTEGSQCLLKIPSEALTWSFWAIILYWLPIIWCIVTCSTPSNRQTDLTMGLVLFVPVIYPFLVQPLLASITSEPISPLFEPLLLLGIPITWLMFVAVYSKKGYYVFGEHFNMLERDFKTFESLKEGMNEEKPKIQDDSIFFDSRFFTLLLVSMLVPCLIGIRHMHAWFGQPDSEFFGFPLQLLALLPDIYTYYSIQAISALLVGVPYTAFSTLNLFWLWERINHRRSMFWVLIGGIISIVVMIPGILVLNWIGWIRLNSPYIVWYTWTPFPLLTFLILGFAVVLWIYESNSEASEHH